VTLTLTPPFLLFITYQTTPIHQHPSAVALTALVTDHWIVPTGSALPFVKHAGLWKVCFARYVSGLSQIQTLFTAPL
jgi:hypothetical protein